MTWSHRWIRTLACTTLAGAAIGAPAQTAPTPPALTGFAWTHTLQTPNADAIQRIELPAAVYTGSARPDLGDLRIFNGAGEIVPHALVHDEAPAEVVTQTFAVRYFPLTGKSTASGDALSLDVRRQADGSLVALHVQAGAARQARVAGVVVDVSSITQALASLELSWTPRPEGTVIAVDIDASEDLQTWRAVTRGAQLVDLRLGDERLRRTQVELGNTHAKYLRLTWADAQEPIAIERASVQTQAREAHAGTARWTDAISTQAGNAAGEYWFESDGLPVQAVRIALPQANTVAPLRIYRRADAKQAWREVASTVVFRIRRDGQEVASPDIALGSSDERLWRVVVDQRGGGLGQGALAIRLAWVPQQLVFVARGAGPFTLAYGNRAVAPAPFDIATLVPGYRAGQFQQIPEAIVGTPTRAALAAASARPVRPIDWKTLGLWAVLLLGVAVLGAMAWRLMGQVSKGNAPGD